MKLSLDWRLGFVWRVTGCWHCGCWGWQLWWGTWNGILACLAWEDCWWNWPATCAHIQTYNKSRVLPFIFVYRFTCPWAYPIIENYNLYKWKQGITHYKMHINNGGLKFQSLRIYIYFFVGYRRQISDHRPGSSVLGWALIQSNLWIRSPLQTKRLWPCFRRGNWFLHGAKSSQIGQSISRAFLGTTGTNWLYINVEVAFSDCRKVHWTKVKGFKVPFIFWNQKR